jgi:hypothetical protein
MMSVMQLQQILEGLAASNGGCLLVPTTSKTVLTMFICR